MAVQYQVANSTRVSGVAVIAAGPYECAEGNLVRALKHCMDATDLHPPPSASRTLGRVYHQFEAGRIDDPANLRRHRVWLLSSDSDRVVNSSVTTALERFYRAVGVPDESVVHESIEGAGHSFPSIELKAAAPCSATEKPYINRCGDFDTAGVLLRHLYGPLQSKADERRGKIIAFDQARYTVQKPIDISMSDTGYLYVPEACFTLGCKVHLAFHGCEQSADEIGTLFVESAGYNAWAETNGIIVVYPQARSRSYLSLGSSRFFFNPKGCWDWWGYTGHHYATRQSPQIESVKRMVDALFKETTE